MCEASNINYLTYSKLSQFRAFTTALDEIAIPQNIQEALIDPKWKEVVMEEMRAVKDNHMGSG